MPKRTSPPQPAARSRRTGSSVSCAHRQAETGEQSAQSGFPPGGRNGNSWAWARVGPADMPWKSASAAAALVTAPSMPTCRNTSMVRMLIRRALGWGEVAVRRSARTDSTP